MRVLTEAELTFVAGGDYGMAGSGDYNFDYGALSGFDYHQYIDNGIGITDPSNGEIVVVANTPESTGDFYGGGWVAGGTGAAVSGGGDDAYASWLVGLGYGYNIGYSTDKSVAENYANNLTDGFALPAPVINGVPVPINLGLISNIEFNLHPFTVGIGVGAGGAYAVATRQRQYN